MFKSFRRHLFDQKYSKNWNILKYYYHSNNSFLFEYIPIWMYSCDVKLNLLQFQCHMKKILLSIIKTVGLLNIIFYFYNIPSLCSINQCGQLYFLSPFSMKCKQRNSGSKNPWRTSQIDIHKPYSEYSAGATGSVHAAVSLGKLSTWFIGNQRTNHTQTHAKLK